MLTSREKEIEFIIPREIIHILGILPKNETRGSSSARQASASYPADKPEDEKERGPD